MVRTPKAITKKDIKILESEIEVTKMVRRDLYEEIQSFKKQLKHLTDEFDRYSESLHELCARYNNAQKLVKISHPRGCQCVEHDLLRNLL